MSTHDPQDGLTDAERKAMQTVLSIHAAPMPEEDDGPECVECGCSYQVDYGSELSRLCHPCAQLVADNDAHVLAQAVERLAHENAALKVERDRLLAGDFTTEEVQGFCHKLTVIVPRSEFEEGCKAYQDKLYEPPPPGGGVRER